MNSDCLLNKKLSIGVSFNKMTSQNWIDIFREYGTYINDIYFSPIENVNFQTRRNVYNYECQNQDFLESELAAVLTAASKMGIARKLVLNVPMLRSQIALLLFTYEKYKEKYDIEYVTTFFSCAREIKKSVPAQPIICSYNQGITSLVDLENILNDNVFYSIVLGNNFLRNIEAFRLIHKYNQKIELLLNNGCMIDCTSFCGLPNRYCESNFKANILRKGINHLYAECSLFPEELHKRLIPLRLIDYYKLSTRPIHYDVLIDLLSSYIQGESYSFIKKRVCNYNLYGRLAHFHSYYQELQYSKIISYKKSLWEQTIKSSYEVQ